MEESLVDDHLSKTVMKSIPCSFKVDEKFNIGQLHAVLEQNDGENLSTNNLKNEFERNVFSNESGMLISESIKESHPSSNIFSYMSYSGDASDMSSNEEDKSVTNVQLNSNSDPSDTHDSVSFDLDSSNKLQSLGSCLIEEPSTQRKSQVKLKKDLDDLLKESAKLIRGIYF